MINLMQPLIFFHGLEGMIKLLGAVPIPGTCGWVRNASQSFGMDAFGMEMA